MNLVMLDISTIDVVIVVGFLIISLLIGLLTSKKSGESSEDFFLSGRNMPWWLLGVSMVATTFAADTPGLVTQFVREEGIFKNWLWWAYLFTGLLTVFFYAKLWRKSNVTTDLEFYELRYGGKLAGYLRGFRAVYLGVIFNVIIMANVCVAGAKIAAVLFGIGQIEFLMVAGGVTVIYSLLGGLKGVLITDFFQFIIAMIGSVWATYYIVNLPEVGGMEGMLAKISPEKLKMFPDTADPSWLGLFLIPICVQWWSTWYPGAEPGGGGYIAQRMLAAKDEKHATFATLFFNVAHYALRPWPWIILALASLVVFPDMASIQETFVVDDPSLLDNHDAAYSAMISLLPAGLFGIVITSLMAAFMSTISTQLNWGSSYVVNDFYKRFLNKNATEKNLVLVGRIATLILMVLAGALSFLINDAGSFFDLLLQMGAGTGLLFILRWFWHRINPYSEITAMLVSFIVALFFFANENLAPEGSDNLFLKVTDNFKLLFNIGFTTMCWVAITFLTKPTPKEKIKEFEALVFSGNDNRDEINRDSISNKYENFGYKLLGFLLAAGAIYGLLLGTGYYCLRESNLAVFCLSLFIVCSLLIFTLRKRIF